MFGDSVVSVTGRQFDVPKKFHDISSVVFGVVTVLLQMYIMLCFVCRVVALFFIAFSPQLQTAAAGISAATMAASLCT